MQASLEETEFERVLSRLGAIKDDARLEQVLAGLLPKLVERLDNTDPKAKKVLIEIFSHVTRWVKSPSVVKLPIVGLAQAIAGEKCTTESQGLRVGIMLIEMGFERAEEKDRIEAVTHLLKATSKLVESQKSLIRFLTPYILSKLNLSIIESHLDWFLDFFLDCCYPTDFFSSSTIRGQRLLGPLLSKKSRSFDDNSNRALDVLNLAIKLAEVDNLKQRCYPVAVLCSLLCATSSYRDDVQSMGEEGLKRLRDELNIECRKEVIDGLFDLILGNTARLKAPPATRVGAIELIGRYYSQETTDSIAKLVKVLISGMFGTDQTPKIRIASLNLLAGTAKYFPSVSPVGNLITSALKQQIVAIDIHEPIADYRIALFHALNNWIVSRAANNELFCDVELSLRVAHILAQETQSDAVSIESQSLFTISQNLRTSWWEVYSDILQADLIRESIEFGTSPAHTKLRSFALHLVSRLVSEEMVQIQSTINLCWILIMTGRPNESKEQRELSQTTMDTLLERNESQLVPSISFVPFLEFIEQREADWIQRKHDFPRDYFYPACLRVFKQLLLHPTSVSDKSSVIRFCKERLSHGLLIFPLDGNFETRALSADCLHLVLTAKYLHIDEIDILFDKSLVSSPINWLSRYLASSNELLRRACASLCGSFLERWPLEIESILKSRIDANALPLFSETHGAICAISYIPSGHHSLHTMSLHLCEWLLDSSNQQNQNRELRNEAYSVLKVLTEKRADLPFAKLIAKCQEILRDKHSDDDLAGTIAFIGSCASAEFINPEDSDIAFNILLRLSSDGRFGLGSQIAVGQALADVRDESRITRAIREILQKNIFEESSNKSRSSAAILLEQILLNDHSSHSWQNDLSLVIDLEDGLIDLLGEPEEHSRMCACRGLGLLYFKRARPEYQAQLLSHIIRRLSMASQPSAPSSVPLSSDSTPNVDDNARSTRRARVRRGSEERYWPYQDLAQAAQQCGNAGLMFHFFQAIASNESVDKFRLALKEVPLSRLAVQFIRRRHFQPDDIIHTVSTKIWALRLRQEHIYDNLQISSAIWKDSLHLLRDSFFAKERRSACLTLSEITSKTPDDQEFVCGLEEAWRAVFRGLDDLDETIANGPAIAFGRAIKRRTLIALQKEEATDFDILFAFLLDHGLAHAVKPARDLTRGFLVDSIIQEKLPVTLTVRVVEALLRTIGESESVALQYAQFHARGGGGTGEFDVDASTLEGIRARLALSSPEYSAALKCVSRLRDTAVGIDLVSCIARVIRTGVGLTTLVAAVTMVQFLASDEWDISRQVLDNDTVLLNALTYKFAHDPNIELKKRISASAAALSRLSSAQAVSDYCLMVSLSYDSDPETTVTFRQMAAAAAFELVKRNIYHEKLVRPAFLGRFDEEKPVAETWKACWDAGLSAVIPQDGLINVVSEAINSYSYRTRRQGAEALMTLSSTTQERASYDQLGMDLLTSTTSSTVWEGKEAVCKATGKVFALCKERDLVEYACLEVETALFKEEHAINKVPRPKWLWEALFSGKA